MKTRELAFCGIFAALIAIGAYIRIDIPLPMYTMHFTLQWLFVLMAVFLLGRRGGTVSVIVYIVIGLAGIPVFAAGGGPGYVLRPGFGFLLGFAAASAAAGTVMKVFKANKLRYMIAASAVGLAVYYAAGALYFYFIKNVYIGDAVPFSIIVLQYCLITIIPDFILCITASFISLKLRPHVIRYIEYNGDK